MGRKPAGIDPDGEVKPSKKGELKTITKTMRLHQVQFDFHHSQALYRGFVGGIGSGKSYVGAYDLLRRAMSEDGKGRLYMVISPTYTILQDATMRTIYQLSDELEVTKEKWKQPPRLVLSNGSEIIFRSGDDPDRLRGPNLSGIWMDEASLMSEEVFSICIGRLREGGRMGFLTATFTPKGMGHWTYSVFGKGERDNTALFRSKTSQNPFLAREFVGAVSQQYSDRQASQELDGEFVDQEGAEWPNSHFGEHIWVDDFPKDCETKIKTLAIDPSKGRDSRHGDYSAIVRLSRDTKGILYCDATMVKIDSEKLVNKFVAEAMDFEPDALIVETNQFQHLLAKQILTECQNQGTDIPIIQLYNTINKDVRIRRLGPYLANRNIRFRRSEGSRLLVAQLREFPLGKFDDGPDALEMALRAMIGIWNNRRTRVSRRIIA
jgi:PBSX family phage terminase large subunit